MGAINKIAFRTAAFLILVLILLRWLPRKRARSESLHITETLIVACKHTDDISWLEGHFPVQNTVVSRSAKGREAFAYLNYIVEHYDRISDVSIFVHNHDHAWHNARLLGFRMARMLERLDRDFVRRQGYFNMRCDWEPGCPARLELSLPTTGFAESSSRGNLSTARETAKREDAEADRELETMRSVWPEIHSGEPLPPVLAQPCCSQFAVSRDHLRAVPLERWVGFRDWVLETPLNDWFAGRVWEYMWQYVLAGNQTATWCPSERDCYCYGYNICFEGDAGWAAWKRLEGEAEALRAQYMAVVSKGDEDEKLKEALLGAERRMDKVLEEAATRGQKGRESRQILQL